MRERRNAEEPGDNRATMSAKVSDTTTRREVAAAEAEPPDAERADASAARWTIDSRGAAAPEYTKGIGSHRPSQDATTSAAPSARRAPSKPGTRESMDSEADTGPRVIATIHWMPFSSSDSRQNARHVSPSGENGAMGATALNENLRCRIKEAAG